MASQEAPEAAAVAEEVLGCKNSNSQQEEQREMEIMTTTTADVIMASSDHEVHLRGLHEIRKDSLCTPVLPGETVLEHGSTSRSSTSSHLVPSPSGSAGNTLPSSSSSPDGNCQLQLLHHSPRPLVPDWVMALASSCQEEHGGAPQSAAAAAAAQPRFWMSKKLTKTDLTSDENRLLIPAGFVNSNIIHLLNDEEKKAASLDDYSNKKRTRKPEDAPSPPPEVDIGNDELPLKKRRRTMDKGRQHGGLQVTGWARNLWHFSGLRLTCWDRTKATVLKGEHLKYLYNRSFLREGDQVELWGFRDANGELHLALHKSSSH